MGWAPIGFNAIYREMIQKKALYKKNYLTRLHRNNTYLQGNNTYLQGNNFTRLFTKKD